MSTFDAFKTMSASGAHELSDGELKALQRTLLLVFDDIAAVCASEGIGFSLGGGSALGAARHSGFIPWDDDLDINMRRQDWPRFREAFENRFAGKYAIYAPGEPKNYPLAFPRIRLKGTSVVTREDLLLPGIESGAFVDVFFLESTFENPVLRALHGFGSLALGFLYSCRKIFSERRLLKSWGVKGGTIRFKMIAGFLLAWIPSGFLTRVWDRWNGMCRDGESIWATFPVGRKHFFGELARRETFRPEREALFEGRKVRLHRELESYLTRLYGSGYMAPPPQDKRERHVVFDPFRPAKEP